MKALLVALAAWAALAPAGAASMPRYAHIFVIIEENHTTDQIIGNPAAPVLNRLAKQYGFASNYYAVAHPSEPNYVALVGGDTFGIRDDDAYFCRAGSPQRECGHADAPHYADHTVSAPALTDQLAARGLSWKGYFEDIPEAGSLIVRSSPADAAPSPYVAKHNGFMNFRSVQRDPRRAAKIVGFDALYRDIAAGTLPAFAHIVPSLCDDMHGDRACADDGALVAKADATVGRIVGNIMRTQMWKGPENDAIVVTFDENGGDTDAVHPAGCCGFGPQVAGNQGGGWIATIVVTNHGPRHLVDATPYNHYSLLRSIEDGFGIAQHLGHAGATDVVSMTPLFAVARQ